MQTTDSKSCQVITPSKTRTKCEVWTRVMGYHRPVSQYNFGKKSEFYSRLYFQEQATFNSIFVKKYSLAK